MKHSPAFLIALFTASLTPLLAEAIVVNIDFDGQRPGDSAPVTASVVGALGTTGTTFNGLQVISDGTASTTTGDNQTPVVTNLVDEFNVPTTVDFTVGPVGGDDNGAGDLIGEYFFNNSAGTNVVGAAGSPFVFSQLPGTTADLFFYTSINGSNNFVTINGSTGTLTTMGGFAGRFFDDVPIVGGVISGTLADLLADGAETSVVSGVSISTVPEPSTLALIGLGAIGVVIGRRRRTN